MEITQFWQLIEASRTDLSGDDLCNAQAQNLKKLLLKFSAEELIQFDDIFDQLIAAAYRWDLWGAATIINGGASDDGFTYFRWWLIAQGRNYYEAALENPDNAGDNADTEEDAECEAIRYCAAEAYQENTGAEMPHEAKGCYPPAQPAGTKWKEEELEELYPRLCEKFG